MSSGAFRFKRRTRMEWTEVEERIVDDDRNKWDRKASAAELQIVPDGLIEVGLDQSAADRLPISGLAASQVCQRLRIPVFYYRRLPAELQATVANYDLDRLNKSAFLLGGKDEWIRA